MEKQDTIPVGEESSSRTPVSTPAYFVILQQSNGENGKTEEGILVANRDVSSVAPIMSTGLERSNSKASLSADCTSGKITVTLDNNNMWNEFYHCTTEMILTKQGRRMFPYCRYWLSGLCPYQKYILVMDITPMDNHRYKWNGQSWEPGGVSEPHVLGRVFIHPESPSTGQFWMQQPVSFYKLKLTNNILDPDGHIILHSMHRYLPRLHVIPASKTTEVIQLNGPDVHTFTFLQTEFIAVTAYQNFQITQLKIDCNPFARGFREGSMTGRLLKFLKPKNLNQEGEASNFKTALDLENSECDQKMGEQFRASDHSDVEIESEEFISEHDFMNFFNRNMEHGSPEQKDDNHQSFDGNSHAASPMNVDGQLKTVIKEEPVDSYDYDKPVSVEKVDIKQESEEEVTDEYSNSDDDYPILERQLRKQSAQFRAETNKKRSQLHSLGAPKAKILKLDSGKMPVVYLEPCSYSKSNMKASDLEKMGLNTEKLRSLLERATQAVAQYHPDSLNQNITPIADAGNSEKESCQTKANSVENLMPTDHLIDSKVSSANIKKLPFLLPKPTENKKVEVQQPFVPAVRNKRGRPRKHKVAQLPLSTPKKTTIELPQQDVNPDLMDVDGVLFVAFASKEALNVHTGGKPTKPTLSSCQEPPISKEEKDNKWRIQEFERQLLIHLRTARHKQVIHPALQQVGLKLNIVGPSMSIDLRYLGVQLPLPYIDNNTRWDNYGLCAQASGFPFVSRTGKTNDFTKIKGWRDKFSTNSPCEGNSSESSLKNRSAFCSDKLDEYLENEAKLMENCKGISQNESESSIVYQLPTKSTSYVRTLDSVLKKQVSQTQPSPTSLKTLSLSHKKQTKFTSKTPTPKVKPNFKNILPLPLNAKEKSTGSPVPGKPVKSLLTGHQIGSAVSDSSVATSPAPSSTVINSPPPSSSISKSVNTNSTLSTSAAPNSMLSIEENMLPSICPTSQQNSHHSSLRPAGISKAYMKLLDMEECIVWDGKPRTYITEERADIALATLLTAQASLKNKLIHKVIRRRTGNCRNEFCRLGCVCFSLNREKMKSTHCRRMDCMFGCTCLKHKVILVKGGVKIQKISKENVHDISEDERVSAAQENPEVVEDFCPMLPKPSTTHFPIWKKVEEDSDSEPICTPMPNHLNELKNPGMETESRQQDKTRSAGITKPVRVYVPKPNPVVHPEEMDPVYLYFDSMMTCARVRAYAPKQPESRSEANDQYNCDTSDFSAKEDSRKSKHRYKEKERQEDDYETLCSSKWYRKSSPTKLIEVISNCSWEEERSRVLSIVSQNMFRKEPQYFKVGSLNIQLMSGVRSGDAPGAPSYSSRVKISVAEDADSDDAVENQDHRRESFLRWKIESIKLPKSNFKETSPEREPPGKLLGGKGLPFYTKIIPAGKLLAELKNPNAKDLQFVQVNGKKYPQAKLLLGHMGALHPANRLAAYITHRLRPSLYNLANHAALNPIVATKKAAPSPSNTDVKSKEGSLTPQKVTVPTQNESPTQPSSVFTKFVMNEVGALQQRNPAACLSAPVHGSQMLGTQTSPLMVITPVSLNKPAPLICTTSTNISSLTTLSLTATTAGTVSPPRNNEVISVPSLISKLVTKESSLSNTAGVTDTASSANGISITPSKDASAVPNSAAVTPTLSQSTVNPSTLPLPLISNVSLKTIASTLATCLITPGSVTAHGSAPSQTGLNDVPSLSLNPENSAPQPTIHITKSPSETEKRLGPRLLLIPVQSSTQTARQVQTVSHTPGQKMVLQPIKSPTGANLFRHPSGQIIQLVPIQQIRAQNIPASNHIIYRNPGSIMSFRLPLPSKAEVPSTPVAPVLSPTVSSASISTSSVVSSGSTPVTLVSTVNPSTIGVTAVSSVPPFLSQMSTLRLRITPTTNDASPRTTAKVIIYNSAGQAIGTDGLPLQPGSFSLLNVPSQNAVSKPSPVPVTDNSNLKTEANSVSVSSVVKDPAEPFTTEKRLENDDHIDSLESHKSGSLTDNPDKAVHNFTAIKTVVSESHNQTFVGNTSSDEGQECIDLSQDTNISDKPMKPKVIDKAQLQGNMESGAQESVETESLLTELPADTGIKDQNALSNNEKKTETTTLKQNPVNSKPITEDEMCTLAVSSVLESVRKENKSGKVSSAYEKESYVGGGRDCDIIDCTLSDSHSEGDVDVENSEADDDSVDIETVEELTEKINIARLKASVSDSTLSPHKSTDSTTASNVQKNGSKKGNLFRKEANEDSTTYHRRNHTANERRRRNEMRDLFEELKNSLGLHYLPKVSKSYILKQAIEEIEGLTDQADTLITRKSALSQKKAFLIKKVSSLSGKTKEVVLKKLEYICAKQKAAEAEKKKQHFEEDIALQKASLMARLPRTEEEPFPTFRKEETAVEIPSVASQKPLILVRKKAQIPVETTHLQSVVSLSANMVIAPQGPLLTLKTPVITGQVEAVTSTALQTKFHAHIPGAAQPGLTSVTLQLPCPIQVNGIRADNPVPLTLSTVPQHAISGVLPPSPDDENEDLSMMPKIVNVTSLANEVSIDLDGDIGLSTKVVNEDPVTVKTTVSETIADRAHTAAEDSDIESIVAPPLVLLDSTPLPNATPETLGASLIGSLPLAVSSIAKKDTLSGTGNVLVKDSSVCKVAAKDVQELRQELDLKKVASAVDESELVPSDLIDGIGEHEDTDETLTSLLNEIAFLNQQLNSDDLDSSSDFPASDTASRGSVSKFTDGDVSPFSFGRFKELSEIKEKSTSLSPLFLQLEEGEIQESSRQSEETGIMAFVGTNRDEASPSSSQTSFGLQEINMNVLSHQTASKQETFATDSLWRPMPKLAPLGLKAAALLPEPCAQEPKAMPFLAPVTSRLSSQKPTSPVEEKPGDRATTSSHETIT